MARNHSKQMDMSRGMPMKPAGPGTTPRSGHDGSKKPQNSYATHAKPTIPPASKGAWQAGCSKTKMA